MEYPKASKYPDLAEVYAQCCGPGGLKLAEFIAERLNLTPGMLLLDVGTNWGYQSCFLAKEYGVVAVAIDPSEANISRLKENVRSWDVQENVLGLKTGVPDTPFADDSFSVAYSTTTLEMIRGMHGEDVFRDSLSEIRRVLRPGALFGYGDPMHMPVEIPSDVAPLVEGDWGKCFATLDETLDAFMAAGFEVVESGYAPDAKQWWEEYAQHDQGCKDDPDGDPRTIEVDAGRWVSFGYIIARKPNSPP